MRLKALILAAVSASVLFVACGNQKGAETAKVSTKEMRFSPSALAVEAGRRTISVRNNGELVHTFSLNELGREVTVQPGRTKILTVSLEPGTYKYVCRILDHEGLGMHGVLRVRAT
ncbi:MAG TPA: cupredoxin domain-containing protein [Acidimicrobiales bacterium]|nr:cupredoxin domain-containing protein [Acidimicrobiales bacterium]